MRLMIIEDDKSIAKSLDEFFTLAGHDCDICNDPKKGVSSFKVGKYDLVLTDIRMPGMDGIKVLKTIKECDPEAYVIIMTGFANVDNAIEAVNSGAYAFFRKPLDIALVMETLRQVEAEIKNRKRTGSVESELFDLCIEYKDFEDSLRDKSGGTEKI